jgi:oligoribonuclease
MPQIDNYLHYRNVDVSSVKELVHRWYPGFKAYKKDKAHTALADITESIDELKYYRSRLFVKDF